VPEQKLEITKQQLDEIATNFLDALERLDAQILIRDAAEAQVMTVYPICEALLTQEIERARCTPVILKDLKERYQAVRERIPKQLAQENLDASAFLRYLLGCGTHYVR
jgi:hypothetical protein